MELVHFIGYLWTLSVRKLDSVDDRSFNEYEGLEESEMSGETELLSDIPLQHQQMTYDLDRG